MTDAADALLLSLEVEAAAARNAELSDTVEALQAEVLRLRHANAALSTESPSAPWRPQGSLPRTPEAPSVAAAAGVRCAAPTDAADAREMFLILDDLLFEVADMRSRTAPEDGVDLAPRTFSAVTTATAHAARCLAEARRLKEVLIVKQHSAAAHVAELRRALSEQIEASERQSAASALECTTLQRRCDELQRRCDALVVRQGEAVLDRVIHATPR
ncbi:hypothetical protein NESM_000098400 [Novymonas esmeraldas]|uniref:Uncharacterized protein n=1 Tax=Novymonas esmeraldas TaxID=1808958 RepID=A0AAW0F1G8_9TRYP